MERVQMLIAIHRSIIANAPQEDKTYLGKAIADLLVYVLGADNEADK